MLCNDLLMCDLNFSVPQVPYTRVRTPCPLTHSHTMYTVDDQHG